MPAASARTLLFVPGDRPERFPKAAASGADIVIIDLEDAVSMSAKDRARRSVATWLSTHPEAAVRINPVETDDFIKDLEALAGYSPTVVLAKTERAADVRDVSQQLRDSTIIALIETALGVLSAPKIAQAGATRLALGNVDLAIDLGVNPADRTALANARGALVIASAAARISGPIDGVTTDLRNPEVVASDSRHAALLGFTGKLCIHPAQVEAVRAAFTPTEADVEWAQSIMQAAGAASPTTGAFSVNGHMIDAPVVERASRILRRR